jgi:hypothetical protein
MVKKSVMRPEAFDMARELVKHHAEICSKVSATVEEMTDAQVHQCCIRYGLLCERINAPYLARISGGFLHDIAVWCEEESWPPINALVMNQHGIPGDGYDTAPGGGYAEWPKQVRRAIAFKEYKLPSL